MNKTTKQTYKQPEKITKYVCIYSRIWQANWKIDHLN